MHRTPISRFITAVLLVLALCPIAQAININVQYTPGTLFYPGIDATAKASINAAAADVSAVITSSLDGLSEDVFIGEYERTTVTYDWRYFYTNPSTGAMVDINSPQIGYDSVTLFVGARNLGVFPGGVAPLGVGGPAGIGVSLGASGFPAESPIAVTSGANQSQTALSRGNGPVIGTVSGDFDFFGTVTPYSVDYGAAYGVLSFDVDEDNDGSRDSASSLDEYWHWNHTTNVGSGKNDLYTVAVHEILHTLGIGASNSWDELTSGTTWNGSEVQAITGSGANLISSGGDHVASSVMSTRISDGSPQEVVMDPTITNGKRKELTVLDLAFLRDIGYETITAPMPNPPDFDGDGDVDELDLMVITDAFGQSGAGDVDGDTDTDGAELLEWQRQFTGSSGISSLATIPEPSSVCLLLLGLAMASRRRVVTRL